MASRQAQMNIMTSEDIAKSLYRLIHKDRHKDFIEFAKSFGMSEKAIRKQMARL